MPAEGNRVVCRGRASSRRPLKPHASRTRRAASSPRRPPFDASNVMLICPSCGKPTRVGHKSGELNGKKTAIRVCKKCGAEF